MMELALSLSIHPSPLPPPGNDLAFYISSGQQSFHRGDEDTVLSPDPSLRLPDLPLRAPPRTVNQKHPATADTFYVDGSRLEAGMLSSVRHGKRNTGSEDKNDNMKAGNKEEEDEEEEEAAAEKVCSWRMMSDEEENGMCRKKLRLSKEQSAFLEESFKEHHTLNPRQKLVLAKRLNLRPRQVEVWFQNRRARTKLKQTEVECEYLRRWCETLREENRKIQKEVQELRALKASQPFYMQVPATTLTICPSCERTASGRHPFQPLPGGVHL